MARTREQKEKAVHDLASRLKRQKSFVISGFSSLPIRELDGLRHEMRKSGGEYVVAKKKLLARAFSDSGLPSFDLSHLVQTCGLAFGYDDPVAPARILARFIKSHETSAIVGGMIEGRVLSQEEARALALIPPRDELKQQAVSVIAAPLRSFVGTLCANMRAFLSVVSRIKKA